MSRCVLVYRSHFCPSSAFRYQARQKMAPKLVRRRPAVAMKSRPAAAAPAAQAEAAPAAQVLRSAPQAEAAAARFAIYIVDPEDEFFTLYVNASDTVTVLKFQIEVYLFNHGQEAMLNAAPLLILGNESMVDHRTLGSYDIRSGSIVKMGMPIQVQVNDGWRIMLHVCPWYDVDRVKVLLHNMAAIPWVQLRLAFAGEVCNPYRTLREYGIVRDCVLHIM